MGYRERVHALGMLYGGYALEIITLCHSPNILLSLDPRGNLS